MDQKEVTSFFNNQSGFSDTTTPAARIDPFGDPNNIGGYVTAGIILIIMIAAIIGNTLVITAVAFTEKLQTTTNAFVVSLAVSDVLFASLTLPLYMDTYIYRRPRFNIYICQFNTYFGSILLMNSTFLMGAIALNRYISIVHANSDGFLTSKKFVIIKMLICWLVPVFFLVIFHFKYTAVEYQDLVGRCNFERTKSRIGLTFLLAVGFFGPFFMKLYCYTKIYFVIRASRNRLYLMKSTLTKIDHPESSVLKAVFDNNQQKRHNRELKVTKMMVTVYFAFLLTYLPFTMLNIVDITLSAPRPIYLALAAVLWAGCCINPIIYGLMNKQFRHAYKNITIARICQHPPSQSSSAHNLERTDDTSSV